MLFEVVVERWDFSPRRCCVVSYKKGQRGCLPYEKISRAVEAGLLVLVQDA